MSSLRALIERRLDDATAGDAAGRTDADATWPLLVLAALDGPDALESTLAPSAGTAPPSTAATPPADSGATPSAATTITPPGAPTATAARPATTATPPGPARATAPSATAATPPTTPAAPAPAHLLAITVEGFRGVGPPTRLDLAAGPGLTLVVGRNGSGKSSFAEAAELLLTGDTYRWSHKKTSVWRDGWRNLHHPRAAIACELAIEGQPGKTTIARTWPDDATDVALGPPTTVQLAGRPRLDLTDPASPLRWGDAITSYRPFLSYNELGSMLDEEPSKLYDALSAILGLGDLTTARDTLAAARKGRDATVKAANERRKGLIAELTTHPDPRAAPLAKLLDRRDWGLDDALRLATAGLDATTTVDPILTALGALARLPAPDVAVATAAADTLHAAALRRDATTGTLAARADQLATLLDHALRFHTAHGDGDCPVCGRPAALDATWHAAKATEATALRDTARAATEAQQACAAALRTLRTLPWPTPSALPAPAVSAPADPGTAGPPTTTDRPAAIATPPSATPATTTAGTPDPFARHFAPLAALQSDATPDLHRQAADAATALAALTTTLADLTAAAPDLAARADALRLDAPLLAEALQALRTAAATELTRREDRWRPLAARVAAFVPDARTALAGKATAADLKSAEDWLSTAEDAIRRERFAPLADHTRALWESLRHESNVTLERVDLLGVRTRRRVELAVAVDGVGATGGATARATASAAGTSSSAGTASPPSPGPGADKTPAALGVMSQGELNALALSLFIPRATLAESPFRFLLIDDPVQSMDPARIDGLARVLHRVAADRQVVVFTHDDRLPEAVRRLGLAAHVVEVTRRPGSLVELRPARDPVARALDDAFALAKETSLPPETARRVVPGLCRQALEAACTETIRRRRLARGDRHADVETLLADATKLYPLTALALFDDPDRTGDVLTALNNRVGPFAATTFKACNEGAHGTWSGDPITLVRDTEKLARTLQSVAAPSPVAARTTPPGPSR